MFIVLYAASVSFAQMLDYKTMPVKPPQNQLFKYESKQKSNFDYQSLVFSKETALTFSASVQVNRDSGNQINEFSPVIEVSKQGVIYVVWNADETLKSIFFSSSTDGGKTFSAAIKINDAVNYPVSYSVYQPDIALDTDGNIYIVWHDYRAWLNDSSWTSPIDIFLDKSTDGGLTWNTDIQVSGGSGTYPWHFQPSIATDKNNGNIYVSFTDYDRYYPQGDHGDISVTRSTNRGASFEAKVRVDDTADSLLAIQTFSDIAVDSAASNLYVTFNDSRNSSKDIYIAKSTDYCQSFLNNILVNTDTTNDQEEPSIKTDKTGNVYVVWKDWKSDSTPKEFPYLNDIYIAKSTDNGNSFSSSVKVNDQYMNAEYEFNFPPRLTIDNLGIIHVAWPEFRFGYTTCFYDQSLDGGQTFAEDVIIPDNRDSLSHTLPRIAVSNNNKVYVAWMDKSNGNNFYDIFVSTKENLTSVEEVKNFPLSFSLSQNYPNPFNPNTKIRYTIPGVETLLATSVQLKVFDILGNEVATLVDEYKPAGSYDVDFDASYLSSGVYFYKLQAGSFVETRKLMLLK